MPDLAAALEVREPAARRRLLASLQGVEGAPAEVTEALYALLGDDDPGVRHATVDLVGRTRPALDAEAPVPRALTRAVRDDSPARRAAAVDAFGRLGPPAVPLLVPLLGEEQDGLRRLGVDALGLTGAREAAIPLIGALDDRSPAVRAAAVEALCRADPHVADRQLRTLLRKKDEPPSVRLSALLSLESLGARPDPSELRPHVADPLTAVPALRLLGAAGAARDLVDALQKLRGSRLRAALAGIAAAFHVDRGALARALTSRTLVLDEIEAMLTGPDPSAAEGALVVGAFLGRSSWFAAVAARVDRSRLLPAAHAAARELREANAATALQRLAEASNDAPAAAFLAEIAQGLDVPAAPSAPRASVRPRLDEESFRRLAALYLRVAGLHFDASAAYRLESRLQVRLEAAGIRDFPSYLSLIEGHSDAARAELAASLERVTVHETYFFREPGQLDAFSGTILPLLAREAAAARVRLWSAGCSTGEEVWTLAMLLEESRKFRPGSYEIVGSDIAPGVVEAARAGVYGQRGFRGELTAAMRDRYFEPVERGYRIKDGLRKNVAFKTQNLLDFAGGDPRGHYDVIFCRNVLIYFTRAARSSLIQRFYDLLAPGGLLLLGHSESLLNLETPFAFAAVARELVYVKPSEGRGRRLGDALLGAGKA